MTELKYLFFESEICSLDNLIWGLHIPIPSELVDKLISEDHKRIVYHVKDSEPLHRAMMPDGNGGFYLLLNKEIQKKQKLELGEKVKVKIRKDDSRYGMNISEEMLELLDQDEEGSHYFHKLTDGKQRSLIYIATKPKSSAKRVEKALVILDYLKSTQGKLDFKELNIAFKEFNADRYFGM